jgi:predicted O-methyltransferase YrrM
LGIQDLKTLISGCACTQPNGTGCVCGSPVLRLFRIRATDAGIPIIGEKTQCILSHLVRYQSPRYILELGSAVGFSALVMMMAQRKIVDQTMKTNTTRKLNTGKSKMRLLGVEMDLERARAAVKTLRSLRMSRHTEIRCQDASEVVALLPDRSMDFIFMDAAKGQYIALLPDVLRVARAGAIVACDNIFMHGESPDFSQITWEAALIKNERRRRTMLRKLGEFVDVIKRYAPDVVISEASDGLLVFRVK